MTIWSKILASLGINLISKLLGALFTWASNALKKRSRDSKIDLEKEKLDKLREAVKEKGEELTDEEKQKIVDAARDLISDY